MKTSLGVAVILVSAFSVFAQGQVQVVECSLEMRESFFQTLPVTPVTYIPSLPDFQMQVDQAGIQSVPEPSVFALGGLALGLGFFAILSRNFNLCFQKSR